MYELPLVQTSMFIDLLFSLYNPPTLGTRDFLARFPVSVKLVASAYGRRCVGLRQTPKIHAARKKNLWYPGYDPSNGRHKKVKTEGDLLTAIARGRGEGKIK